MGCGGTTTNFVTAGCCSIGLLKVWSVCQVYARWLLTCCLCWLLQAPLDSIRGTVNALGPAVDLSVVFGDIAAGPSYQLRSVICYFGHHYQAFVLSEELHQWLLFDDHVIKVVGDWQQVKQAMVSSRLQPSLLFYESSEAISGCSGSSTGYV
eukprot:GHRR01016834.1.p2 GENE.GHRR01016834.1~~GHRR01016834.1.p2  ORF type:complete len:152 (+),score=43.25 GHRR01016834.1:79-534(+)